MDEAADRVVEEQRRIRMDFAETSPGLVHDFDEAHYSSVKRQLSETYMSILNSCGLVSWEP
jgi:hypothetical protein